MPEEPINLLLHELAVCTLQQNLDSCQMEVIDVIIDVIIRDGFPLIREQGASLDL